MKHSESIKTIAPAIVRAQAEIGVVVANSDNPFFKSKYANLDACWDALKGPLQKEGIALIQTMGFIPGAGPTLITTLMHSSGEYISGEQPVCAAKDDPQGMGSAITYARRYGLSAILALVQVDDDGEGAMNSTRQPKEVAQAGTNLRAVSDPVNPGSYVIRMGKKWIGKTLEQVGPHEASNYGNYLKRSADESGKPLDAIAQETVNAIEAFCKSRETKQAK